MFTSNLDVCSSSSTSLMVWIFVKGVSGSTLFGGWRSFEVIRFLDEIKFKIMFVENVIKHTDQ